MRRTEDRLRRAKKNPGSTVRIEYAVPRKKVETAIQRYLKRISAKIKLHKAILFGSYAHDDYSPGSDIDIAIVAYDLPRDPGKRFAMLKDTILGLDLQPFAYTSKEWDKMVKTHSSFAIEILKHGKVLVPSEGGRKGEKSYYGNAIAIGPFKAEEDVKRHE